MHLPNALYASQARRRVRYALRAAGSHRAGVEPRLTPPPFHALVALQPAVGTTLQAAQTQRPASLTSQLTASTKAGGGSLPSGTTTTAAAAARVLAALNGDMAQRLEAIEARCAHIEVALSTCASFLPLHAHRCRPKLTPRCPV